MQEKYEQEWMLRANLVTKDGKLDNMIQEQLYDLTWRISSEFIIKKLSLHKGMKIFDAGFGWGRIIIGLKHYLPNLEIDGVELTKELYSKASLLIKERSLHGLKLFNKNLFDLSFVKVQTYDAIYSTRVLHYIIDKQRALKNLYRILKPSGKILIIIPNRYCPYRWFTYKRPLFSIRKLKNIMIKCGYRDLEVGAYGFIPTFIGRKSYKSSLYIFEMLLRNIPILNEMGGLAYVAGRK